MKDKVTQKILRKDKEEGLGEKRERRDEREKMEEKEMQRWIPKRGHKKGKPKENKQM